MCRAVRCDNCGKTTWAGCGKHVDQVMSAVPAADRCTCERSKAGAGSAAGSRSGPSVLGRLFGRSS